MMSFDGSPDTALHRHRETGFVLESLYKDQDDGVEVDPEYVFLDGSQGVCAHGVVDCAETRGVGW